jgi:acetyl-CoA synthetase
MPLMDPSIGDFAALRASFRWQIPARFNIAAAVCDRHVDRASQIALYCETESGRESRYTFADIRNFSNRLANALAAAGVGRGDRVAIVLPQRVEAALAHVAVYKLGAIAVPLSILFGPDALEYRLGDSGARLALVDGAHRPMLAELADRLDSLEAVIDCDDDGPAGFRQRVERASDRFRVVDTDADDPALLIYTSGTTGPPKGALVAHRCLLGNLTGFELSQNFFPRPGDLFWTPADWAWTGGLIDALLPSWYYGVPVLGTTGRRFDPERACRLLARYRVRNAFIPPTALKMMRQLGDLRQRFGVELRSVMSAGEQMGAELLDWGRESLGLEINEMWGQSEFNYIVGNCADIMPARGGSMGKPYPGHRVEPLAEDGSVMPDNEIGELCAFRDDPVLFLGYWNNDQATRDKFHGDWWRTGDVGFRDEDGYLWFVGRKDDVISSAGYRIGPGEIEDCLLKHPAVAQAAAIGSPDPLRGEVVKAFIVLAEGYRGSDALADEIRESVRRRLAAYEYPREVEFIDALPLTTTGKVRRLELRQRERARKQSREGGQVG